MTDFGFYLVLTDPVAGYERCAEAAVRAGVRMLQLRMKNAPREGVLRTARALRRITAGTVTRLIVNDDPSIAAEAEADGVHVGQGDLPVAEVRARFPALGIVGLSTHSPEQLRAAASAAPGAVPDYVGAGPVWATPTKAIPDPTLGLEQLSRMVAEAPFPVVAIGGIDEGRLPAVLAAGAHNFAVVRAVCRSPDPLAAIRRLQAIAESAIPILLERQGIREGTYPAAS